MAGTLSATVALSRVVASFDGAIPGILLRWGTVFVTFLLTIAVLYRVRPSGGRERLPFVTVGGVAAAAALVAECGLFSWTVGHFSKLEVTYGSLSTVAAFLLWLWVSVVIVLAGAELDMALDRESRLHGVVGIRRRGTVEGSPGPGGTS